MENYVIRQMTNQDSEFYCLMGPYLSRRQIEKEIGYRVYDDDDKIWFITIYKNDVIGFAAIMPHKNFDMLSSAYVLPQYRNCGMYSQLLAKRLSVCTKKVKAIATDSSIDILKKNGFKVIGKKGRFYKVEK